MHFQLVLALASALFSTVCYSATPAAGVRGTAFTPFGVMEYTVYSPRFRDRGRHPLVVALHGCHQGPEDFAKLSRLNEWADRQGFVVLYPEQPLVANVDKCWNWFFPLNQTRLAGEPAMIALTTEKVMRDYPVDSNRVYVLGVSAGGAMANTVASCFPDLFKAAAIHSGLEYMGGVDVATAYYAMTNGSALSGSNSGTYAFSCGGARNPVPAIILQGDQDTRNNPKNASMTFEQFAQMEDWADNGRDDGSTSVASASHQEITATPGRLNYRVDSLENRRHGWKARMIWVHGMAHAWSGGPPGLPYSEPRGPDATAMILKFFQEVNP